MADAQDKTDAWRNHYNAVRLHSSNGNLSPADSVPASAETAMPVDGKAELALLI